MTTAPLVTNDRQAREASATVQQIEHALSSEQVLKAIVEGLPKEVIDGVRRSLLAEKRELSQLLQAYHDSQQGRFGPITDRAGSDPGAVLIIARLKNGWSQKELARRLFLPEQQVQRYEAERYRSISLANLLRVARTLGANINATFDNSLKEPWFHSYEMSKSELQKVLKHAREHGWLDKADQSDENGINQVRRLVAEHVGEFGTPSLLRTGLNVKDHSDDWLLLAWKAQATRQALQIIQRRRPKYKPIEFSWLRELVQLSQLADGPVRAQGLLLEHGIVLVIEPHVSGLKVDGAAFLLDETPVIGLTLLRDALDNFWFTLLHEVAHVVLHYRTGLAFGFFDDTDNPNVDELEGEADQFASNLLIPEELWNRTPARISKNSNPIEVFAGQLGISPAIVFGRIRRERKNYTIFADKIGIGQTRKQFLLQH